MSFKKFKNSSGFKVLAMARLTPCEYSIVLYLLNCAASGLNDVISTESELASLIGYEEPVLRKAMKNLNDRQIVKLSFGAPHANPDIDSMRIGLEYDLSKWKLDFQKDVTLGDAIVFPFRRSGVKNFQIYNGEKEDSATSKAKKTIPTWKRIFESFIKDRSLDDEEIAKNEEAAKMLVETHHVDQLLLIIRHFKARIPTLSLLASSWQHYLELFEDETQKVDLLGAKQKYFELDQRLREQARLALEKAEEFELSEEERTVLNILIQHRHPRRQLFWAYQSRSRYPKLNSFLNDNIDLMVPVTHSGKVIPKPHMFD